MQKDNQKSQIIIYKAENGQTKIEVRFENETVWLTQNALAELFQTTKQNISQHIKNILDEGELQQNSVVKDFLTTAADGKKLNMGLTNWRGNKPTKEEVIIAKNYLNEQELLVLNNLVEQYLVFAEGQAMQRVPMYMKDWIERLHEFLQINRKDILKDAGKISHELAKELAEKEYNRYYKKSLKAPSKADRDFEVFANKATKLVSKSKKQQAPKISKRG